MRRQGILALRLAAPLVKVHRQPQDRLLDGGRNHGRGRVFFRQVEAQAALNQTLRRRQMAAQKGIIDGAKVGIEQQKADTGVYQALFPPKPAGGKAKPKKKK